jgi:uncharacterized protein (TIGR03032 family)
MAHSPPVQPPPAEPWLQVYGSRGLPEWLERQSLSLAFSTYQTGKLFFIGSRAGQLSVFERTFDRAMGLYGNAQTLWLSTRYQLWRFENMLAAGQLHEGHDRLYVPRVGFTTGDIDIHDVVVEDTGRVVFVATSCSSLATLSPRLSFQPLWRPPFISKLATEDRCHLNGLTLREGKARYVTAVSRSDVADGWRNRRDDGGCVIDVTTNDIVAQGLSMPHSPRWYQGKLWVLESGNGGVGVIDEKTGKYQEICRLPGFTRGLDFAGNLAFVGLSQVRESAVFSGIVIAEMKPEDRCCGVWVIDIRNGQIVGFVKFTQSVNEIFAVQLLPGMIWPDVVSEDPKRIAECYELPDLAMDMVPADWRDPAAGEKT